MFSRTLWVLSAVLLSQIIFITWTLFDDFADAREETSFIDLDRSEIVEILIKKANRPALRMKHSNSRWILPELSSTPINSSQLEVLISKLLSIKSSWPVAQTQASIEQFHVGEHNFLAKIDFILTSKETLTVLLGQSPGVNSTYARIAGNRDIYRIAFNMLDLSVRPEDWLDTKK